MVFPDGQLCHYHVPVVKVQKYTKDEIFQKKLFLFAVLYPEIRKRIFCNRKESSEIGLSGTGISGYNGKDAARAHEYRVYFFV